GADEARHRERAVRRKAEHANAVEHLDGFLPGALRHDGRDLHAAPGELAADHARRAPEAAEFAPREDLYAQETNFHDALSPAACRGRSRHTVHNSHSPPSSPRMNVRPSTSME